MLAGVADRLPRTVELGSLVAIGALALLGQGLIRDLSWLLKHRRDAGAEPKEEANCLCLESTIGLSAVLAGVALTAVGVTRVVSLTPAGWAGSALGIWLVGYLIKDTAVQWSPWRLRRVKDHGSLLVRWRRVSR